MKVLKALIYRKADIQPLVDGSTKTRVRAVDFEMKYIEHPKLLKYTTLGLKDTIISKSVLLSYITT